MDTETQPQEQQAPATDDLLNIPETVKAFGKEYQVRRFSIGQLMQAAEHIAPLSYLIEIAQQGNVISLLMEVLATARKPALGLLSVACEEPVEWLEEQDPIEGYELLSAYVERNARYFFDSENKRRIDAATARIKAAIPPSGPQSAPLSDTDTAH